MVLKFFVERTYFTESLMSTKKQLNIIVSNKQRHWILFFISISDAKFCTLDWPFFLICKKWSKFVATKIIDILSSQTSVSAEYPSHQTGVQAHHCKTSAEWVAHHWAIFCRVWLITKSCRVANAKLNVYPYIIPDLKPQLELEFEVGGALFNASTVRLKDFWPHL